MRIIPSCLALLLLGACVQASLESLRPTVVMYNQALRWKRFQMAADFWVPEQRAAFLERFQKGEDALAIGSIQLRSLVADPSHTERQAKATVVAEAYLLPSTVVRRIVVVQTWRSVGGEWLLVETDKELHAALDDGGS